jgi:NADH-quinone oxidoreductase subunit L
MPAPLILLLISLLLPTGSFLLLTTAGRRMGTPFCGIVGALATLGALATSLVAMMQWLNGGTQGAMAWGAGRGTLRESMTWANAVTFGIHADSLTILFVTAGLLTSGIIHVYTTGYLRHDVRGPRVLALLSLLNASLVGTVTSASLVQWSIWSTIGSVAAYLLATPVPIGPGGLGVTPVPRGLLPAQLSIRAGAALTFFLTRCLGDALILLAAALMSRSAPGGSWSAIWTVMHHPPAAAWLLVAAALCHAGSFPFAVHFAAAQGSATPAAALSAAVVTLPSGVLLLARVFPMLGPKHLDALAIAGGTTLFLAGFAAIREVDLRRLMAWLAIGSMGAAVAAIGAGSLGGALLHVVACMFGTSIVFLAGGSVLHNCLGERRMTHYGDLLFRMPASALLLAHGSATLLGGPLLAGSGSWTTMLSHAYRGVQERALGGTIAFPALCGGLLLMAAAAARAWSTLMLGPSRDAQLRRSARESATLTVPVALLALIATVASHPTLSPVWQLVTVLPHEMSALVAPEDPGLWEDQRMALARDAAPPAPRPPPAPEDEPADRAAADLSADSSDERYPRLIKPAQWTLALVGAAIGLPLGLGTRRLIQPFLPYRPLAATFRGLFQTAGTLASAADQFLLTPLYELAGGVLFPFASHAGSQRAETRKIALVITLATLLLVAMITLYHIKGPGFRIPH